jgi:hypothetical protein
MKALYLAATVAAISVFGLSYASAAPVQSGALSQPVAPIVLAQDRHDQHGHDSHRSRAGQPHYAAGRRYRSAPHGWHRYSRRPGDWQTRGCILVGPLWFCP